VQGRLDQLMRLLPTEEDWSPRSFFRSPHPLMALVWQGRLDRAREILDDVPAAVRSGAHTDLWFFHEAWLLWAEGRTAEALTSAEAAVEHSRRTEFGWEPCFEVVVGRLQLLLGAIDDARMTLADAISKSAASGNRAYVEWGQTFQGLAFLRADLPEDAARVLRSAAAAMQAAGRELMLPIAAAYLAEAEARCGHPEAADAAADLAVATAEATDCRFILRQALAEVPAVLRRRLERAPTDERWRALIGRQEPERRTPSATRVTEAPMIVEVRTQGPNPDIVVDGVARGSRRAKVLELAAYLALHPDGVERNRLQERLFPDGDPRRGGNYFRQVVHKLRQVTGISLSRTAQGLVGWPADVHVDSTDLRFERIAAAAREHAGIDRLERLEAALRLVEGVYLPDSELEWAEQRRHELEVSIVDAALEAGRLALELGHIKRAREIASFAIDRDPYCEAAYCVRMEVEARLGSDHAVLAEFHRLTETLAELGVTPAPSTRRLMQTLRA
jgi:LuxR family transcriptional regulator, maltose regulon positive regulatory protein